MKKKLKLFVWENVLTDYTDGVMFALAPDVESARAAILDKLGYDAAQAARSTVGSDLAKEPKVFDGQTVGSAVWGGG